MVGVLVCIALHAGERHPVVGGVHNQRVSQLPIFFQRFQDTGHVAVEVLDFVGVVQQIGAGGE